MKRYSLALIALLLTTGLACKSSSPSSPAKKKPSSDQVPEVDDDSSFDPPSSDCTNNSSSSSDDDAEDDGFDLRSFFGFGLQSTKVTYDSDVKRILTAYCVSCHSGTTDPDISSYTAAKNAASAIAASVKPGASSPMPPAGGLSDSDKQKLEQWITDGTLEKDTSSSSSDDDESSSSDGSSSSDCDTGSSSSDDDTDDDSTSSDDDSTSSDDDEDDDNVVADWEDFLNPERLKECKDEGKVFDRVKNDCHKSKVATFTCDKSSIVAKYAAFESAYESIIDDGYQLDQCGEYNGDPIILFYKKDETNSELKLKVRKLCKKDSPACST